MVHFRKRVAAGLKVKQLSQSNLTFWQFQLPDLVTVFLNEFETKLYGPDAVIDTEKKLSC